MSSVMVACSALPLISSSTSAYHGQMLYIYAALSPAQHFVNHFSFAFAHFRVSVSLHHLAYILPHVSIHDSDWLGHEAGNDCILEIWQFVC